MGERSDQIEEQIQRTREDLRDNLNELEQKVRNTFDWRTQFEERPLMMLTVALGGGMLLAALLRRGGNGTATANRIGGFLGQLLAGYGMRVIGK
jgi:hypothetical protein